MPELERWPLDATPCPISAAKLDDLGRGLHYT